MSVCACCQGTRAFHSVYSRQGAWAVGCPHCAGCGFEPAQRAVHPSMLLRNVRSGKIWAVYAWYPADNNWGIHRMKPAKRGSPYVWQILHRTTEQLLDEKQWVLAGYGDAWDHEKMESDPLRPVARIPGPSAGCGAAPARP